MSSVALVSGGWQGWLKLGRTLGTAPGVHAPSAFSALLADSLRDLGGRVVVDAGCGAGLVSIAALAAGAELVIALDRDPAALRVTERNVQAAAIEGAAHRLTTVRADFNRLAEFQAELIAVNPPQRPSELLDQVEAAQRHLHEGGGDDGLQTLRLVLRSSGDATVRSTAARPLDVRGMLGEPALSGRSAEVTASAALPAHACWEALAGPGPLDVDIWSFGPVRSTAVR